jgi:hypothetical protein
MARSDTDPDLTPGEFAADREQTSVILVVDVADTTAENYELEDLDSQTVAEYPTNEGYAGDVPVVEIVYVSDLNYRLREERGIDWTPGQVVGLHAGRNLPRYEIQSYPVPASRLREINTDSSGTMTA